MLFDIYIVLKVFLKKSEVNIFIKMPRVRKSFSEGQAKTVFFFELGQAKTLSLRIVNIIV